MVTEKMIEALKPCPFCGSDHIRQYKDRTWYRITCNQCGANGGASNQADVSARMWNRRAEAALSTDAEPVGTPIGFTDAAELNSDTGHGLFAYAGSDASWLSSPIPLYAKCPEVAQDRAEYEGREQVCKDAALSQWERSLKRPDLDEKSRVIGAIEAFKRQAFAFTMLDAALSAQVQDVAGLRGWQGWDKSRMPWSEAKHKDAVCYAAFGEAWSMNDAAALIGFIERTWTEAPAAKLEEKPSWRYPNIFDDAEGRN